MNLTQYNLRQKILDQIQIIENNSPGIGQNPYTVNVITYSGHGIDYGGDAIAVIPEYLEKDAPQKSARFINLSGIARRLAAKNRTINIFLLSMCRIHVTENIEQKIVADETEASVYKHLKEDALGKTNRHEGYP